MRPGSRGRRRGGAGTWEGGEIRRRTPGSIGERPIASWLLALTLAGAAAVPAETSRQPSRQLPLRTLIASMLDLLGPAPAARPATPDEHGDSGSSPGGGAASRRGVGHLLPFCGSEVNPSGYCP